MRLVFLLFFEMYFEVYYSLITFLAKRNFSIHTHTQRHILLYIGEEFYIHSLSTFFFTNDPISIFICLTQNWVLDVLYCIVRWCNSDLWIIYKLRLDFVLCFSFAQEIFGIYLQLPCWKKNIKHWAIKLMGTILTNLRV